MPQLHGCATESALTYLLCRPAYMSCVSVYVLVVLALQFTLNSV